MHIPLVDLKAQYEGIRDEVNAAMQQVLDETCFILGPPVEKFEQEFAAFCHAKHCISVASGTDALQLIYRGLGIGPGDEVIVPAFTFIATALGVTLAGATLVLVDVLAEDGLLDPDKIEAAITPRTKAICPVHLYGRCADMERIRAIAAAHGLSVVEDAAQAHGATQNGRRAGSLGTAAGFSFYPGKNLGAYGDGGAITTNDDDLADRLRLIRNWGSRKKYHHEEVGLNSRLDTIHAAALRVKLAHLDNWNASRRRHAATYGQLLAGRRDLRLPSEPADGESVYHLYVLRVGDRDAKLAHLQQQGVGAGIHYPFPVHHLAAYRQLAVIGGSLRESEGWAAECLSLPMFPELTQEQLQFVAERIPGQNVQRRAA